MMKCRIVPAVLYMLIALTACTEDLEFSSSFEKKVTVNCLIEDFWNMVDKGKSRIEIYEKGLLKEKVNLMCWEEFYNYYDDSDLEHCQGRFQI